MSAIPRRVNHELVSKQQAKARSIDYTALKNMFGGHRYRDEGINTIVFICWRKNKIDLIKEIQEKEVRNWECRKPIYQNDNGFFVAEMVLKGVK